MSNYHVNLQFTADTAQAKSQLQSLQQQLTSLINAPMNFGEKLTPSIQEATAAAAELKVHLQNATNVNTGTLDFGKLNHSIKQSGMTISEYGAKLQSLGPMGQQAFMTLANSVAAAEVPLRRSSGALTGLMTTLKNTAKWQLSSSLLHGFIGGIQSAYNYAQDLNESLNNIRIVTGYNIDQMSKFAAEANKAAKALSTTTTEYTNASLIYYQQGLTDTQVKERTDVTIKMANVSRQSAEVVSDQLTAIWNNFDDGTKSLEYYVDVVTALGAATASSSEEISTGLEKFASVAETVGLSYEYATAALATVTATTRQSADVVGTAFKTLFARLQDLKLGETLDDGTTLGSYSANLAKVGVQIKDSSGQLKDMDIILEEVAEKWKTLDRDQQVALAKGVAGIRQYNTFMSLMANWDFMEENLETVKNSSGTLQKQADIYAESWEAAQKRVQASAEKMYKTLFNDKFFISLTNGFASLIDKVGDFVQSIGGLGGVLSSLGYIVTKVFAQQMAQGFRNLIYNIQMSTDAGKHAIQQAKKLEMEKLAGMMAKSDASTAAEIQTRTVYSQELQLQTELVANSEKMTVEEQKKYAILLQQHKAIGQQTVELQRQVELHKDRAAQQSTEVIGTGMHNGSTFDEMYKSIQKLRTSATGLVDVQQQLKLIGEKGSASSKQIDTLKASLKAAGMNQKSIDGLKGSFDALEQGGREAGIAMEKIQAILRNISQSKLRSVINSAGIREGTAEYRRLEQALQEYVNQITEAYTKEKQFDAANKNLNTSFKTLKAQIQAAGVAVQDWATHLSSIVSGIMSAGMLISSINGLINTIEDPDASGWEKFGSILTSVAMIAMSFSGTLKLLSASVEFCRAVFNKETLAKIANATASYLQAKASAKVAKTKKDEAVSTGASAAALDKENKEKAESIILDKATGRSGKLTTGTYKSGPQQGKTWYKHGGKNITAEKYAELSGGAGGAGGKSGSLLKPGTLQTLGKFAGGALAVAAAVAIVAVTITAAVSQYERFEKAAQEANTAASMVSESYNDAKSAYEDFSSTASEYKNVVKSMKEMTKGTTEYTEAMLNANEQALKLIKNYKSLAGQYTIDGGLIIIDEEALARVQEEELAKLGKAQSSSILSESVAREAASTADRAKFNRDMNSSSDNGWTAGNAAVTGVAGGAAGFLGTMGGFMLAGSSAGPVGLIVGAVVGAVVGIIGGIVATEVAGAQSQAEADALDKVVKYVQKNGNDIFGAKNAEEFGKMLKNANLEIEDEDLVKSLYDNKDALQQLTAVEIARLEQERSDWSAAYAAYNMGNSDYTTAGSQTYLNEMGYKTSHDQATIDAVTSEVQGMWSGSNDDFWKAYLEEVLGDTNVDEDSTTGDSYRVQDLGGSNVTLQKKTDKGTWETIGEKDSLNEDAAEKQLIEARLMAKASSNMSKDIQSYNVLSNDLKLSGLTDDKLINTILEAFAADKQVDLSSFAPEVVKSIVTDTINDPDLKAAVEQAVDNYEIPSWYDELSEEEKKLALELNIDKDASIDEVKTTLAAMQEYLDANHLEVTITAYDELETLLKANTKDWDKIWEQYAKILGKASAEELTAAEKMEFLQKNEEEMLQWIQQKRTQAVQMLSSEIPQSIDGINAKIEQSESNLAKAKDEAAVISEYLGDWQVLSTGQWDEKVPLYEKWANSGDKMATDMVKWMNSENPYEEFGDDYLTNLMNQNTKTDSDGNRVYDSENAFLSQDIVQFLIDYNNGLTQDIVNANKNNPLYAMYADGYDAAMHPGNPDDPTEPGYPIPDSWDDYMQNYSFIDPMVIFSTMQDMYADDKVAHYNGEYEKYNGEGGIIPTKQATLDTDKGMLVDAYQDKLDWQDAFESENEKLNLDASVIDDYANTLIDLANSGQEVNSALKDNEFLTQKVAQGIVRLDRGFNDLIDNWDSYKEILDDNDKTSIEYTKTVSKLREHMADMLDIDTSDFDSSWITSAENLALLGRIAAGDASAIDELREAAAKYIVLNLDTTHTETEFNAAKDKILQGITDLSNQDIKIGATLKETEFAQSLLKAAQSAKMTVDDIQKMFEGLGWEPEITMEEYTLKDTDVANGYIDVPSDLDGNIQRIPLQSSMTVGSTIRYPVIKSDSSTGGMIYRGAASSTADANKDDSGGGSKPKKTKHTKKSDVVERYKEVNDQIDDIRNAMDDAKRAAEGLWGAARLKKMREVQSEMKKELKLMRQRRDEAKAYLEEDRAALQDAASKNGTAAFEFDAKGNITNYDEIMNGLYAELKAAQDAAGPTTDDKEQEKIDAIQERIDAIKEAIADFDATREQLEDFEDEIDEWVRSIQEAYLEELNLELEMKVMIDDSQLAKIEYYLGKVSEDIWSMAESAALMTGQGKDLFNFDLGQAEVWIGKFDDFKKRYDDLLYAYTHIDPETGETFINQEQFVKALAELQEDIYSNLDNINELDKNMISYYGDTLAAAGEELSKFTDLMDHHVGVLDHYASLLEIMGKSKDWDRIKTIQKTQVELAENSAAVSKANYEMLQAEAEEKKQAWEALGKGLGDELTYEESVIKQQWLDAQNAANEAQNKMLEDAQAWAEALKALLETELEELGENLEKALAGDFGTLDYMMTSMERANSLQEEYLTTTNKIYETNKLMRSAQQEIDKTSNTVAKRRMAQFIEETQQMQNQNKLSQFELDIQQAKYDLLLAEIALEEAQNAKSTVRLQRDNEGNFGYVYTADQNEVANAQQELEDAQNALYNIGLEGANKYAEQYAQTIQEMNDAVRALTEQWQNGEIASKEEYQAKMLELEEYYGEKLKQFSHLHSIAVQTDSRVANDAWTRDFAHMTTQTEYWMTQVSGYADKVGEAFGRYQAGIAEVEEYAGADLESLRSLTEGIKDENEALTNSITNEEDGLLTAMQAEIDKVKEITDEYIKWRDSIKDVIDEQENLANQINKDIEQETDDDTSNDYKPETEESDTPDETPPEGGDAGGDGDTASYQKGTLSWTGNGSSRIWTDSEGKTYKATSAEGKAIQNAFNRAYGANGGYHGDYFLGWNKLNADVLHEKYGLSTGGYTGDWSGSFGKLAFLHQKELVLNKQDTENLLAAMEFLNRITAAIDLQAMNSSLGGLLSSPSLGHVGDESGILEQQVHIEASFPGVSDRNELEEAFNNLINQAAQYANRK